MTVEAVVEITRNVIGTDPTLIASPSSRATGAVTDFGLARSLAETTRTGHGSLLGTIPYMSPERIKGKVGGKSADIWSLGIVFFQLLVGCFPWESHLNETLVIEITQTRPDVALWVAPAAGAEVAGVVAAMLDPDPATRIQDGGALARALDGVKAVESASSAWPRAGADGPQLVDSFDSRADTA